MTNQWVNSYKRLVPGYEAPIYLSWARRNRSDLIRVPQYKPGKENATRIEYRAPDPACNPYLAFAVMLMAGLEGIEKGYECPPPVEQNVYHMPAEERDRLGIKSLPGDLGEAIEEAETERTAAPHPGRPRLREVHREQEDRVARLPGRRSRSTSWRSTCPCCKLAEEPRVETAGASWTMGAPVAFGLSG